MKWKIIFLTFAFTVSHFNLALAQENKSGDSQQSETDNDSGLKNQLKILPALVLTPELILGSLALAVGMGIITAQENRDLTARMSRGLDDLTEGTRREIEGIVAKVRERQSNANSQTKPEDRVLPCKGGPHACCDKYLEKFKTERSDGSGYETTKERIVKVGNSILCCLQWDFKHGVWEVFDKSGRHKGERSCLDLQDDPCSRSEKLDVAKSSNHKPYGGKCGKSSN